MQNPLPPLYEMDETEEQLEPGQRIVPESFGDGLEWYEHALRLEQLRLGRQEQQNKIEIFFSNEEALIEAIEAHCSIMKYVSIEKPTMLSKNFCVRAYTNYIEQK
jgi:hypothetical protein